MHKTELSAAVKLVEVGPRDGLQNEMRFVPTEIKLQFINQLAATGLRFIEATSFVSPRVIPQLSDHRELMQQLPRQHNIHYPVLVPNLQGLENAIKVGVTEIAVFTAASNSFTHKNINCTVAESLERFKPVFEKAQAEHVSVRGYISCVAGCPYEGYVNPATVANIAKTLIDMGCYEISLGDTIGIGTPKDIAELLHVVGQEVPLSIIAGHFHDTYGQALANIYVALEQGVSIFDCSVAGLGGCPYARGATGNVASEDVVYLLSGCGMVTGVDLNRLIEVGNFICQYLGRRSSSKVALARAPQASKNLCAQVA